MSVLEAKHIAVRPLPTGYSLRVERAPLILPGYVARKRDAYRSPSPLIVIPPPQEVPDDTADLDAVRWERQNSRLWLVRTAAMCAALLGLVLLIVFSRR